MKKWLPVIGVLLFVGVGMAMIFLSSDENPRLVPKPEPDRPNEHVAPPLPDESAPNGEMPPTEAPPPQRDDGDTPLPPHLDGGDDDDEIKPPDIPKFLDPLLDDDDEQGKPAPFSRPEDN